MFELEYTNAMLLEIVQKHVEDYERDRESIDSISIGGETVNGKRITYIQIVTPNTNCISEDTYVETGDSMELTF